jgi:dimethylhistidine N-methyltransferase
MISVAQPGRSAGPANFRMVRLGAAAGIDLEEVLAGLSREQRFLPAKLFYDARGSELFNAICETDAYYPTRTERAIYAAHADELAALVGPGCTVIEPGAADLSKARMLAGALRPATYVAIDVSEQQLVSAGVCFAADHPEVDVLAVCGDFGRLVAVAPHLPDSDRRIAFFPGSTIGNFDPDAAREFLSLLRTLVGDDGAAIVGVDLCKPKPILDLAYNDPEGITRAFNLNMLTRLNRELGANFDERRFCHRAWYDESRGRVEMHLVSMVAQTVRLAGHKFRFAPGESIHTECSYKYAPDDFARLAREAGFPAHRLFTDPRGWFGVFLLFDR